MAGAPKLTTCLGDVCTTRKAALTDISEDLQMLLQRELPIQNKVKNSIIVLVK